MTEQIAFVFFIICTAIGICLVFNCDHYQREDGNYISAFGFLLIALGAAIAISYSVKIK